MDSIHSRSHAHSPFACRASVCVHARRLASQPCSCRFAEMGIRPRKREAKARSRDGGKGQPTSRAGLRGFGWSWMTGEMMDRLGHRSRGRQPVRRGLACSSLDPLSVVYVGTGSSPEVPSICSYNMGIPVNAPFHTDWAVSGARKRTRAAKCKNSFRLLGGAPTQTARLRPRRSEMAEELARESLQGATNQQAQPRWMPSHPAIPSWPATRQPMQPGRKATSISRAHQMTSQTERACVLLQGRDCQRIGLGCTRWPVPSTQPQPVHATLPKTPDRQCGTGCCRPCPWPSAVNCPAVRRLLGSVSIAQPKGDPGLVEAGASSNSQVSARPVLPWRTTVEEGTPCHLAAGGQETLG